MRGLWATLAFAAQFVARVAAQAQAPTTSASLTASTTYAPTNTWTPAPVCSNGGTAPGAGQYGGGVYQDAYGTFWEVECEYDWTAQTYQDSLGFHYKDTQGSLYYNGSTGTTFTSQVYAAVYVVQFSPNALCPRLNGTMYTTAAGQQMWMLCGYEVTAGNFNPTPAATSSTFAGCIAACDQYQTSGNCTAALWQYGQGNEPGYGGTNGNGACYLKIGTMQGFTGSQVYAVAYRVGYGPALSVSSSTMASSSTQTSSSTSTLTPSETAVSFTCPAVDQQPIVENGAYWTAGCSATISPRNSFANVPATNSWSDCFLICDGTVGCTAFTYFGVAQGAGPGTCYLANGTTYGFASNDTTHVAAVRSSNFQPIVTTTYSTTTTTSSTSSSSSAPCTAVPFTFNERRTTNVGETVQIVGSIAALGSWNTANAVNLNSSGYTTQNPIWTVTILLPLNTYFEYKYVWQGQYEAGANHAYTSPGTCAPVTINDSWQYQATTTTSTMTTSTTSSSSSSAAATTNAYTCPANSGQVITDAGGIQYKLQCSGDTSSGSYNSFGAANSFNDCFTYCDTNQGSPGQAGHVGSGQSYCSSFTYSGGANGVGGGNCYLKNGVTDSFTTGSGTNFVAAIKVVHQPAHIFELLSLFIEHVGVRTICHGHLYNVKYRDYNSSLDSNSDHDKTGHIELRVNLHDIVSHDPDPDNNCCKFSPGAWLIGAAGWSFVSYSLLMYECAQVSTAPASTNTVTSTMPASTNAATLTQTTLSIQPASTITSTQPTTVVSTMAQSTATATATTTLAITTTQQTVSVSTQPASTVQTTIVSTLAQSTATYTTVSYATQTYTTSYAVTQTQTSVQPGKQLASFLQFRFSRVTSGMALRELH
ncbi:hypothetical protein LTR95_001659 [Oleoguttula sp. CCFEE 5521]